MPTTPEQIAQIETVLRQRFFPLVPKRPTNQPEEWHDADRLSRSLAAYAIVGLADVDDNVATAAITDGGDDGGIDALFFDKPRNRILVVQSKFNRKGGTPDQADVLKTINGVRALQARRFNEFNKLFQNRLVEIEELLSTPGAVMHVVLAHLGDNLGPHATNDLNALCTEMNAFTERCTWASHGGSAAHGWTVAEQSLTAVSTEFVLEKWYSILSPRKAVYGQISAAALADLITRHGKALFQRNIRHYLGSVGVNTAIEQTIRLQPNDLFYLNNGLTAVAERIEQAQGGNDRCTFRLTNVSIVNGAQTAGSVATAGLAGPVSADAKLLITIIEIGKNQDDIGLRITRARNHQNVVRSVDFAALDPTQERLRQELAAAGITYFYRPSAESRLRREDAFTLEEAAVAISCLSFPILTAAEAALFRSRNQPAMNAVDFIVAAKKEVGRLWDQEGSLYAQLFSPSLSGLRMCRLVRIHRFVDQILAASEASENKYARRMFFRHGRPFVMAFVARRCSEVINRPAHAVTVDDITILSRRTNEVAEIVYSASESLQLYKGYLAIFRNLTDAQPLAERVIARFVEVDRPAPPPAPPANIAAPAAQQGNVQ